MRAFCTQTVLALPFMLFACATSGGDAPMPLSPGTEWVAYAPGYIAEAEQVYADAKSFVEDQSANRPDGSWAVILDVDETVLNNVAYQISLDRTGASYSPQSWYAWTQKEEATLVPGAASFVEKVNALGGHVALVTNRSDKEQLATENNLAKLGIARADDFRVLLTRSSPDGDSDKETRFELVTEILRVQGYRDVEIVAYVGDNVGDKPKQRDKWEFFCIDQGGMYGDPCAAVPGPGL